MGGKEKAPAAMCRKVASADEGGTIEIWGDGKQTRSFLHVQDCCDAVRQLMDSDFSGPVNIGSEEMIYQRPLQDGNGNWQQTSEHQEHPWPNWRARKKLR